MCKKRAQPDHNTTAGARHQHASPVTVATSAPVTALHTRHTAPVQLRSSSAPSTRPAAAATEPTRVARMLYNAHTLPTTPHPHTRVIASTKFGVVVLTRATAHQKADTREGHTLNHVVQRRLTSTSNKVTHVHTRAVRE